jgi:hypothetical protein
MNAKIFQIGTTCMNIMAEYLRTAFPTNLLPLLLFLTLPAVVQAQFQHETNNGTITITGYTGPGGAVVIPSTINDLPVTRIGGGAFQSQTNLTSVTIPDSVVIIDYQAFAFCASLTNVTIPNGVSSIGSSTFYYCTSLTTITIPNSVTNIGLWPFFGCASLKVITVDGLNPVYSSADGVLFDKNQTRLVECPGGKPGNYTIPNSVIIIEIFAFLSCTNLTSVTIPNSVRSIGEAAFGSCSSLTSVTIPGSLDYIQQQTFSGCTSLTNVTIPNSVNTIGSYAFSSCASLNGIMIPRGVTSIYGGAFSGCTSLTAITVDALNPVYSSLDGVLFNKSQTWLIVCPAGKTGSYTIPQGVTTIGSFELCAGLTNVTIPNSVTHINGTFSQCTGLTSLTIPSSVIVISSGAFASDTNLMGVYFEGDALTPPYLGTDVFDGVNNATVYYLPGTTGWGLTFGNRPTALWRPQIQSNATSFGVRTNQFGFNIAWASGTVVVVDACTNLANPIWFPLKTNSLTGGVSYFSDPQWTNYRSRFYRIRSL